MTWVKVPSAGLAGRRASWDGGQRHQRSQRCEHPVLAGLAAARRVTKAPPLDARDRRYWLYVIVTCALPAAAAFVVVMWRPGWAWWALAAELTAIAVLTVAWRALRAVKARATAVMATTEDVASAEEQERRDAGMPGERPDG